MGSLLSGGGWAASKLQVSHGWSDALRPGPAVAGEEEEEGAHGRRLHH